MSEKIKNSIPKGFLKKYRYGKANEILFLTLQKGFLRLEYGLYDDP